MLTLLPSSASTIERRAALVNDAGVQKASA